MSRPAHQAFPIGTRVIERAYPDSPPGTVTGHAFDDWIFVRWGATCHLSHPPHTLAKAEEQ